MAVIQQYTCPIHIHMHFSAVSYRDMLTLLQLNSSADVPIDNERYISLRFPTRMAATLHGFAGYFETVLYDEITLSTFYCLR